MPLVSLQERLRAISTGLGAVIPNDGFRVLAADNTENGLSIGSEEGQRALDPLLSGVDLVIFDNLSTLCTNGSESASDAWVPMQNWLLKLRRQGIAVLLVHHAGTNGRQRGTSRREDALDTVIALRRPEDYSPEQGARFEVHFEKLRNRVDGDGAVPFEAKLGAISADENDGVRWSDRDLRPPVLKQAAAAFSGWTFGPRGRRHACASARPKQGDFAFGHWMEGCWLMASPTEARSVLRQKHPHFPDSTLFLMERGSVRHPMVSRFTSNRRMECVQMPRK